MIDVQDHIIGKAVLEHLRSDPSRHPCNGRKIRGGVGGDGHGGQTLQGGFEGCSNGSGIQNVAAEIAASINSGKDESRRLSQNLQSDDHAIGRCTIDGKPVRSNLLVAQRKIKRDTVTRGTAFPVGSYDRNLAELRKDPFKGTETGSMNAVVVGKKNS